MRRHAIIIGLLIVFLASSLIAVVSLRPAPPTAAFPAALSDDDKLVIIRLALEVEQQKMVDSLKRREFRNAWTHLRNAKRQTVRTVSAMSDDRIWVTIGIPPTAEDGYEIRFIHSMRKKDGQWVIERPRW